MERAGEEFSERDGEVVSKSDRSLLLFGGALDCCSRRGLSLLSMVLPLYSYGGAWRWCYVNTGQWHMGAEARERRDGLTHWTAAA